VADKYPSNSEDQKLIELIKRDAIVMGNKAIDDMIEFDIRKNTFYRSLFWLWNHKKHDISIMRLILCTLKAIKYRLRLH